MTFQNCGFFMFIFISLLILCVVNGNEEISFNPDTFLPTNKIIQRHGYPSESHEVTTEDGYILTLHRIPHGKDGYSNASLPPIFFQHGILGSSADWVISGPEKALPYILAEKGHDVWMGNIRGNTYSRGHVSLSPDSVPFWNFSFHEMGTRDVATMIDYVLNKTGKNDLYYVGHSMGSTMFYVLCSTKPEYNAKIKSMFALAPVAFMSHAQSPIRYFAPYAKDIELISRWFGDGEFLPRNAFINFVLKHGCKAKTFESKLCENNLFIICGHDPVEFDLSLIPVIFGHTPAGTSTKTLAHFAQEIQSGDFRQFDYGAEENFRQYGTYEPPAYNLSQITAPISLHFADNDYLANPKDVKQLAESLPNLVGAWRIDFNLFNHLDFLWCKDINRLVNSKVVSLIDTYELGMSVEDAPSVDEIVDINLIEEPVFNDVTSLLKYKVTSTATNYLDSVMGLKMSAEKKLVNFKHKTKKTIERRLKSLTSFFGFMNPATEYEEEPVTEIITSDDQ